MKRSFLLMLALGLSLPALAKVPAHEAEALRGTLTPLGGERAGNAKGTIPEWRGGLTAPPPCHAARARYCDPFADDKPYATITADTIEDWREQLSAAHIDMLLRHRQTFRLHLYPAHRSFANPGAVYEAAFRNAQHATLTADGLGLRDASLAVPFPIPKEGVETVWNHRLRYRGPSFQRWISQASVTASGEPSLVRLREDADFPYARGQVGRKDVAQQWLHLVLQPERLLGTFTLMQDSLDGAAAPPRAWRRTPGVPGTRSERSFGFDNPGMLSDDLRFDDQHDGFFGSPERYTWRIVARREMVMPYNSYRLHSGRRHLREILRPAHLEPGLVRHELHRVWVVEATLKPKAIHRHKRRTFYIDEDSWQVLMVDLYDRNDRLWRWQEAHTLMAYDRVVLMPAVEAVYDLESSRYLVQGIDEDDPERIETGFDEKHFTPGGAKAQVPK